MMRSSLNDRARRDVRRGGFTLIELLVSVAIIGILAALALPNMRPVLLRASATKLAGDMEVVRIAALNYNAERQAWPSETSAGSIPPGLAPFLPDGFLFTKDGYQIDFENWSLPGGLPGDPNTTQLIAVSVIVPDEQLGNALIELLRSALLFSAGGTHTIVIDRS